MALQANVCKQCGTEFEAHPTARTAKLGYCSPRCITDAVE